MAVSVNSRASAAMRSSSDISGNVHGGGIDLGGGSGGNQTLKVVVAVLILAALALPLIAGRKRK